MGVDEAGEVPDVGAVLTADPVGGRGEDEGEDEVAAAEREAASVEAEVDGTEAAYERAREASS